MFEVRLITFPDKDQGDPLESVYEGEEEAVNEETVVDRVEFVQRSHYVDKDLAKLILAAGVNAGALEETDK